MVEYSTRREIGQYICASNIYIITPLTSHTIIFPQENNSQDRKYFSLAEEKKEVIDLILVVVEEWIVPAPPAETA